MIASCLFYMQFYSNNNSCILSFWRKQYMSHFQLRNLKAYSVEPLLLFPTRFTGEPGYFSDTETSTIWDDETVATDWDRNHIRGDHSRGDKTPTSIPENSERDKLWLTNKEYSKCLDQIKKLHRLG